MNEPGKKWLKFGIPALIAVIALGFLTNWGGLKSSASTGGGCSDSEDEVSYEKRDLGPILADIKTDKDNRHTYVDEYMTITAGLSTKEDKDSSMHTLAETLDALSVEATENKVKPIAPPPGLTKVPDYTVWPYLVSVLSTKNSGHYASYLGNLSLKNDHHTSAKAHLEEALTLLEKSVGPNAKAVKDTRVTLAGVQIVLGDYNAAEINLSEVKKQDNGTKTEKVAVRIKLARVAMEKRELQKAAALLIEALNIAESARMDNATFANLWYVFSQVATLADRHTEAKSYLLKTLEYYKADGDQKSMAKVYADLAEVEVALKNVNEAKVNIAKVDRIISKEKYGTDNCVIDPVTGLAKCPIPGWNQPGISAAPNAVKDSNEKVSPAPNTVKGSADEKTNPAPNTVKGATGDKKVGSIPGLLLKKSAKAKFAVAAALHAKGDLSAATTLETQAKKELAEALSLYPITYNGVKINGDDISIDLEDFKGIQPVHPGFSVIRERVGTLLVSASNEKDSGAAKARLNQARVLIERFYGPNHPLAADALEKLASIEVKEGLVDVAKTKIDKCMLIRKHIYGEKSPKMVTIYALKGEIAKEDDPNAPNYTKKVLDIKDEYTVEKKGVKLTTIAKDSVNRVKQ